MKGLMKHNDQQEYFRIMEKRIRYFADRYDRGHALDAEGRVSFQPGPPVQRKSVVRSAIHHIVSLNFF